MVGWATGDEMERSNDFQTHSVRSGCKSRDRFTSVALSYFEKSIHDMRPSPRVAR